MNLVGNSFLRKANGRGFSLIGIGFLALLLLFTQAPLSAESSVTTDKNSLFTAYKTASADVIKARSGRFHINTQRTVIVESSAGTAAVREGEASITVTPRYLEVQSLRNTTVIHTEAGITRVAEGETVRQIATPPQEDPVLTSLGMCE